jgi:hypothetical protein
LSVLTQPHVKLTDAGPWHSTEAQKLRAGTAAGPVRFEAPTEVDLLAVDGITFSLITAQMLRRAVLGLPDPDSDLFALA